METHRKITASLRSASLFLTVAAGGFIVAGPAWANSPLDAAFSGGAAFAEVSDTELSDMRGGAAGIAFSLFVSGDISQLGLADSSLPSNVSVINQTAANVSLSIGLASLPGASGFLQFAEVNGNNNIVNNTMTLNVVIVEGGTADPASVLSGLSLGS